MRGLLLGGRSVRREAWLGVALVPALFLAVGVTMLTLRRCFRGCTTCRPTRSNS